MKKLSWLIAVVALAGAEQTEAQAPAAELVYRRDYLYERLEATRTPNDADDRAPIRLVTQVWRPLKNDRKDVVFFSHGSTGALAVAPTEFAGDGPPRPMLQFFLSRGYTVVWPYRRGRGMSTGKYIEECGTLIGECTVAEQMALTDRGLASALDDNWAVLDQLVLGKMVPADGRVLLVGQSRGGFLSLIMAGLRPHQVSGVINFAGGWQSMPERLTPEALQERLDIQAKHLKRAAPTSGVPTIWIFAARDPNYGGSSARDLFRSWLDAGGKGEFLFIEQHNLPNPHAALGAPALWATQVETFLKTVR